MSAAVPVLVLLKRRCFQKYANGLMRCSDYVFDGTKMFWLSRELKDSANVKSELLHNLYKRLIPIEIK